MSGAMKERLLVLVKLEEWFELIQPSLRKFPKAQRFTLVQRIENTCFECMDLVVTANLDKANRARHILSARVASERTRILIRMAWGRSLIDAQHFELYSEKLDEISKMLAGWARATR